jgi:hypothetical protein
VGEEEVKEEEGRPSMPVLCLVTDLFFSVLIKDELACFTRLVRCKHKHPTHSLLTHHSFIHRVTPRTS